MTRTGAVDTLLHSTNILLRTWFNTLMHVVNESSGGEHPAAFLLAGVLARRMAHRGDSHPAKRAMHSEGTWMLRYLGWQPEILEIKLSRYLEAWVPRLATGNPGNQAI